MLERSARWIVVLVLASAAGLAWSAATTDSVTVDEPSHVVAGYSSLATGDFRLSPDHPPLARWLLALPWLGPRSEWRAEGTQAWSEGDFLTLGREFFESWNDGQERIRASRAVAVALFLALLLALGAAARSLHGRLGALVTVGLVAFDPNWLAHGHLATIDVPFALAAMLVLLAADRWLLRPSLRRWALLALALAAATLVKFSWPVLLPALLAMGFVALRNKERRVGPRRLALSAAALALSTGFAIWAAYGFRFPATAPAPGVASGQAEPEAHMLAPLDPGRPRARTPAEAWESVLRDPATGLDRTGAVVPLLRAAHAHRLLPEAYLFGIAFVEKKAQHRAAYLRGAYSERGFASYFPWAAAVKTPLPALLLFVAGTATAAVRMARNRGGRSPLAAGLGLFAGIYFATLASSGLNLGYRHLLPVTAVLAIAAGGLAPDRLPRPWRRRMVVALLLAFGWLLVGTLATAPQWIGYFNESVGGWRNGHRYLADSNLDWGQDLLRLRDRLDREMPETAVWLSQAGDPPLPRGMRVRWLWGDGSHAPNPAPISGGLYVVSATDLLGVYRPLARPATWRDPRLIERFEQAAAERRRSGQDPAPATASSIDELEALRRLRLIARLSARLPDERVGTSLFLFRLSDDEVAEWTTP